MLLTLLEPAFFSSGTTLWTFHSLGREANSKHCLNRLVRGVHNEVTQPFRILEFMLSHPIDLEGSNLVVHQKHP